MKTYTLLILLVFATIPICENFKIGLLLTARPPTQGFPSMQTSGGAVQLAMEEVKRRYNTSVELIWNDTNCDEGRALLSGYDQGTKRKVNVIIGPACRKCKLYDFMRGCGQIWGFTRGFWSVMGLHEGVVVSYGAS